MKSILPLTLVLALPLIAAAQPAAKTNAAVQVTVGDITDNRTTGTFNGDCKVTLRFVGDAAADSRSVRQVKLIEATDDLGRDLIPKDDDDFSHSFDSARRGTLSAEVKLRNPSRNAANIKVLKGEAELFNPTEANGGLLTIKDILAHPAEPVKNPTLAKYGVQVIYLTKESYEAKKKEVEAQEKSGDAAGQKLGEAFGDLFKGMFGGMMSNAKNSIQLYIKDPEKRVINLKFVDGQGKALKSRESWSSNDFKSTGFESAPPADTQLIIQLATPESLTTCPFKVENIPLP